MFPFRAPMVRKKEIFLIVTSGGCWKWYWKVGIVWVIFGFVIRVGEHTSCIYRFLIYPQFGFVRGRRDRKDIICNVYVKLMVRSREEVSRRRKVTSRFSWLKWNLNSLEELEGFIDESSIELTIDIFIFIIKISFFWKQDLILNLSFPFVLSFPGSAGYIFSTTSKYISCSRRSGDYTGIFISIRISCSDYIMETCLTLSMWFFCSLIFLNPYLQLWPRHLLVLQQ